MLQSKGSQKETQRAQRRGNFIEQSEGGTDKGLGYKSNKVCQCGIKIGTSHKLAYIKARKGGGQKVCFIGSNGEGIYRAKRDYSTYQ